MSAAGSGPLEVLGLLELDSGLNLANAIPGKVGAAPPINGWGVSRLANPVVT